MYRYTSIEQTVKDYLDINNVNYEPQFPTNTGFVIDFAIIDRKIAIEVDGKKWHTGKKALRKQRFRDYQLRRGGWTVIHIPEEEIDNLDSLFSSNL